MKPPPPPRILPHLWIYCLQSYSSLPLSGWLLSFNLIIYFSCGRLKIENFWYYPLAVKVLWLGATFYETCKSKLNIEWLSLVFLAKMSLEYLEEKTREFGISDGYRTNVIKVSEVKFWIICVKIVQLGFGSTFNFFILFVMSFEETDSPRLLGELPCCTERSLSPTL